MPGRALIALEDVNSLVRPARAVDPDVATRRGMSPDDRRQLHARLHGRGARTRPARVNVLEPCEVDVELCVTSSFVASRPGGNRQHVLRSSGCQRIVARTGLPGIDPAAVRGQNERGSGDAGLARPAEQAGAGPGSRFPRAGIQPRTRGSGAASYEPHSAAQGTTVTIRLPSSSACNGGRLHVPADTCTYRRPCVHGQSERQRSVGGWY